MFNLKRIQKKVQHRLSHYPGFYALVVGIGIVLFWRGVWHSVDNFHNFISYFYSDSSTSLMFAQWWDGPVSFVVGLTTLYITGAFTSSFIGNELILSGLRGEKKLSERTEADLKSEENTISDIKEELMEISSKLESIGKHENINRDNS